MIESCCHIVFHSDALSYMLIGIVRLKELQDSQIPIEDHYIRFVGTISRRDGDQTEIEYEEEMSSLSAEVRERVVICMFPESSRRLLAATRLESDISFARVSGYLEFELGGWEEYSNKGTRNILPFCTID